MMEGFVDFFIAFYFCLFLILFYWNSFNEKRIKRIEKELGLSSTTGEDCGKKSEVVSNPPFLRKKAGCEKTRDVRE